MSSPNLPAGYERAVEALPVPQRETIVPVFYVRSDMESHNAEPDAIVTQYGVPIAVHGEILRLSMIPPERRFAVQPVKDGTAELYSQEAFDQRHRAWWEEERKFKRADAENPDKWPVPNVRWFAAQKIHPDDPTKLIPLGMPVRYEPPKEPEFKYDARNDRIMSREEWAAEVEAERARDQSDRIAMLEAKIAELVALKESQPEAAEPVAEKPVKKSRTAPIILAPCGAECKGGLGLHNHRKNCPKCNEAPPPPEGDAA